MHGRFRVKGDTVDIILGYSPNIIRIEFSLFGTDDLIGQDKEEVERIFEIDKTTGEIIDDMKYFYIWLARNYVVPENIYDRALSEIEEQLRKDIDKIDDDLVVYRLKQRTNYDLEMIRETGTCKDIENYLQYFDGRRKREKAFCLLDYSPNGDFLMIINESHRTIPQVVGMFNGIRLGRKI